MIPRPVRFVGINFDHMHMGDLLRMVFDHPQAEIVGFATSIRPAWRRPSAASTSRRRTSLAIGGPAWRRPVPMPPSSVRPLRSMRNWWNRSHRGASTSLIEKPFAASLADADRMIAAAAHAGVRLAVNWPLRWYPCHVTAYRLLREGRSATLQEVHYYGGNRGPLWHTADKREVTPTDEMKRQSWFYRRSTGGGSLLDYLGYGATLGTWYHDGRVPLEVSSTCNRPAWKWTSIRSRSAATSAAIEVRDPLGHLYRPMDPATAAQVRVRARRARPAPSAAMTSSPRCGCKPRRVQPGSPLP